METDDRVRLDYEQTTELLRTLTDIRFKLLAFVPTITGATVALVRRPGPAADLLAVGLLGLFATVGVLVYELRNSQIHDAVLDRARQLERKLGLASTLDPAGTHGLFGEDWSDTGRLGGLIVVRYDFGLALVYGAALAGWSYLVAWGILRALDVGEARNIGGAIGIAIGLLVVVEVHRIHRR